MTPLDLDTLPADTRETLARFHFDKIPFEALRERVAATHGDLDALHRITDPITPGSADAVHAFPAPGSAEHTALRSEGEARIAEGELAVVILAGGMATRFGSTVKALAPLFEQQATTFLDAKLTDLARVGRGRIDTTLMTSFATDGAITYALAGRQDVHRAPQFVSLRLDAQGELFRDARGQVSLHATGHGDLPEALATSGTLARWRRAGVRTVLISNVDNLGATADPALFAFHRALGTQISVELVHKVPGDKGGIPVVADGRLVLAEAFRLPPAFPQDDFPLFNTNTLWIDLEALEGTFPWTWCVAKKKVDGAEAIQLERLVGELTWWRSTAYVSVPREGVQSRFIPIKDMDDLVRSRPLIADVLRARTGR